MPIQIDGFKVCGNSKCKQLNPQLVTNFHKDKNNNDGLTNRCQYCNNARKIIWNRANSEKCKVACQKYVSSGKRKAADSAYSKSEHGRNSIANKNLKRLYGITLEQKQQLHDSQYGLCANISCGYNFKNLGDAHVDHNHDTKVVRGLLCGPCNRALGLLKENVQRIVGLAEYTQNSKQ